MLRRPLFHHTPPDGWMNDPVGLCRTGDGGWRLHYQRATDAEHRAMGWGTATSRDLLRWRAEADAIRPDADGWIYSGSVVEDAPGFAHRYAAFYTRHDPAGGCQRQELAVSDDGARWSGSPQNPLIDEGRPETRDPFVFPYDGGWRMIVAEPVAWTKPQAGLSRIAVYVSDDLLAWRRIGELGVEGEPELMFETPVLRRLPIVGEDAASWPWLLLAGVIDRSGDHAVCGTRAWIGSFDGARFVPSQSPEPLDHGPDFYAAAAWTGTGDEVIVTAWASSWAYARQLPGDGWIGGAHALPRRLTGARRDDGGVAIRQQPAALPHGRTVDAAAAGNAYIARAVGPARIVLAGGALVVELSDREARFTRADADPELMTRGFSGHWSHPLAPGWRTATFVVDGCIAELFVDDTMAMTALFRGDAASPTVEGAMTIEAIDP